MRLFHEEGYENVSVGQIAAVAQITVPTVYSHFPSKDHSVMAVRERADIERAVATQPPDLPLADRMRALIVAFLVSLGPEQRSDLLARWRIIAATPGLRYRAATFERTTAGMIVDVLEPGAPGSRASASVLIAAALSAYTEILLRWAETDGAEPLEDVAEQVLATLRSL